MEIAHIIVSALFIVMIGFMGLCVGLAFKKSKNTGSSTDNNEKVFTEKKKIADIENLDLTTFFVNKKHNLI